MSPQKNTKITAVQVSDFLKKNPDFFQKHPEALGHLTLPHEESGAISLIDYQLKSLRAENLKLSKELGLVLTHAAENQSLLNACATLTVNMLKAQDFETLINTLLQDLKSYFELDETSLILDSSRFSAGKEARTDSLENIFREFGQNLFASQPLCGPIRDNQADYLFGSTNVGSVALIGLNSGKTPLGLLGLGSHNPDKFRADMGTLFLSFLATLIEHILPRWSHDE